MTDPPMTDIELHQRSDAEGAGFEMIDSPEFWILPTIEGHEVSLSEFRAFEAYTSLVGSDADRVKVAAQVGGVQPAAVRDWRKHAWWKVLFEAHVESVQEEYQVELLYLHKEGVKGLQRVLS